MVSGMANMAISMLHPEALVANLDIQIGNAILNATVPSMLMMLP